MFVIVLSEYRMADTKRGSFSDWTVFLPPRNNSAALKGSVRFTRMNILIFLLCSTYVRLFYEIFRGKIVDPTDLVLRFLLAYTQDFRMNVFAFFTD